MRSTQNSDLSPTKTTPNSLSKFDSATFDEYAELYEQMISWPYRKELEFPTLAKLLGDTSGLNILDFGCGPGTTSRWLNERGAKKIVGLDISEGMLNYGRRREENEKKASVIFRNLMKIMMNISILFWPSMLCPMQQIEKPYLL